MSDTLPHDLPGTAGDDELVFDEAPPVDIAVSVAAETGASEPRRVPRRGRKSKEGGAPPEPVSASAMPNPSAEADPASAEEPAGAPAPFPPQGADPAGSRSFHLMPVVVGLALLTSTISLGGMIAMSRTLAHAGADRQAAAAERAALASVPTLVAHIDAANARLDAASARLGPAAPATPTPLAPPVTMADLHHEIDALKLALGQRQPDGLGSLDAMTREGFSETATRLDRLTAELDQLKRGGSGGVSASRPASRAGDPRRPS